MVRKAPNAECCAGIIGHRKIVCNCLLVTLRCSYTGRIPPKMGLVEVLDFCFVYHFALDILIFLVLDLMFHHKIYRDHSFYKPLEGQNITSFDACRIQGNRKRQRNLGLFLIYWESLLIVLVNSSPNSLNLCLVS